VVRAIDIGEASEEAGQDLADALVESRDPRIMYLIYEGRSCWSIPHNGYPAWQWQPYTGASPHSGHLHLSTKRTSSADQDTRPWRITMTYHQHNPEPADLPRGWADGDWEEYAEATGTLPESRTWDFYREDLSWFWKREIKPLVKAVAALTKALSALTKRVKALEDQPPTSGVSETRVQEMISDAIEGTTLQPPS
jgi:hypothetical protein